MLIRLIAQRAAKARCVTIPCLLLVAFCGRQVTRTTLSVTGGPQKVVRQAGDTLLYTIDFENDAARDNFIETFEQFMVRYPFGELQVDTVRHYVTVRMLPVVGTAAVSDTMELYGVDRPGFVETLIQQAIDSVVARRPQFGGSAVIYSERSFIDDRIGALVRAYPFAIAVKAPTSGDSAVGAQGTDDTAATRDTNRPYLLASFSSAKRVVLTLSDSLKNAAGQVLTSFDLVDMWSFFVKEHPAEGMALFRHVDGLVSFIRGEEAVIPGFAVTGGNTITMTLEKADADALSRLSTPRLFPASFKLGLYAVKSRKDRSLLLLPNKNHCKSRGFLDRCVLRLGGDRNPFLSYSLKKYDCIALTFRKDLDYARKNISESASLTRGADDRYFISLNIESADIRRYLCDLIDAKDILVNFVKAEGEVLSFVESDSTLNVQNAAAPELFGMPYLDHPLAVVFRKDDPVSVQIAEKVLADLSHIGLDCTLKGASAFEYETALINHDYDLAVGWITEGVLDDRAEKLRLAAMWFGDECDERRRLQGFYEKPLFSIRRYLLCRQGIGFFGDEISGIYREEVE